MILAFRVYTIYRFHGALQGCEDVFNPALLSRFNCRCLAYSHTGRQQQCKSRAQESLIPSLLL